MHGLSAQFQVTNHQIELFTSWMCSYICLRVIIQSGSHFITKWLYDLCGRNHIQLRSLCYKSIGFTAQTSISEVSCTRIPSRSLKKKIVPPNMTKFERHFKSPMQQSIHFELGNYYARSVWAPRFQYIFIHLKTELIRKLICDKKTLQSHPFLKHSFRSNKERWAKKNTSSHWWEGRRFQGAQWRSARDREWRAAWDRFIITVGQWGVSVSTLQR